MKKITLLSILLIIAFFVHAQRSNSSHSIVVSMGTNHYMGDLGGGKKEAAHFMGIRDLDYQVTRPTWQVAYRYKFPGKKYKSLKYFAVRTNFSYALLSGKDAASGHFSRLSRNLSFRSSVFELSGQLEYYFISEKASPRHAFTSLKGTRNISAYLFLGFGGIYFNPKAKDDGGSWVKLHDIGTEGQLTPNFEYPNPFYHPENDPVETLTTPEQYKRVAIAVSMGIGMKYNINRQWAVGLELSNRYTSTDYIDDVHDRYFNYADFGGTNNPISDRHLSVDYESHTVGEPASQYNSGKSMRGNPDYNDAYILALVTLYVRLKKNNRIGPPKFGGRH